jgi:hypothetical protein
LCDSGNLLGFVMASGWLWKAAVAGLCGSLTHTLPMLGKAQLGILEPFQRLQSLQIALSYWIGAYIHRLVPLLLSYLDGSTQQACAKPNASSSRSEWRLRWIETETRGSISLVRN